MLDIVKELCFYTKVLEKMKDREEVVSLTVADGVIRT